MKRFKKLIALSAVLAIALSLASCGKNGDDTKSPASGNGSGGQSQQQTGGDISWPEKPITFVVPWSAGGDTDFFARALAKQLSDELGQTVNVINTVGGGGSVASNEVKDGAPDGYTFLCFDTALALNQASGVTDFGYEAFDPVCLNAKNSGEYLVVRSDFPCNTIAELIEYSKANPGTVKLAANTGATSYYVAVKLTELGGDFNVVNAGSSSERVASLIGGHIDVSSHTMGVISQYLEGTGTGELKILGCMATERSEAYPDIELATEQGVELAYDMVYNILAPKGTDPAIIDKLSSACEKVINNNEEYAKEIWDAYGAAPFFVDTEEAIAALKADQEQYMAYADVFQSGL